VRVTVLGSGSGGNALLVEGGDQRLLVDAGFSGRDLERRLAMVGVDPASVSGLLVTHDHGDHTRGMGIFARRWGVPLLLTEPTRRSCAGLLDGSETVRPYRAAHPFAVGRLEIHPFLTVHDAVDPVAVTITESTTGAKLGIATDLGRPTAAVRHALSGCHLLVLEANHDSVMLRESAYPWGVKQRIASSHGHLSNAAAGELAVEVWHPGLSRIILAHLSAQANHPDAAREEVGRALERRRFRGVIEVAAQGEPLDPVEVTASGTREAQLSLL
jgi:phosphoribosyl 1,2-cyclic phosphodiesterase